ncbi:hypothetical protein [Nocardia gipuzkoensis]|uniref:hypothetical protein n=1 Tax=Nocardia gipuzkoensis TaxID=2749991 RepID=UPI003EE278E3
MAVRLALVGIPQLLADLISSGFGHADDVIVEQLTEVATAVRDDLRARRHDVLILGVENPWDEHLRTEIAQLDAVVLGIRPDGRGTWIYEMRPCPRALGALDPRQLHRVVLDSLSAAGSSSADE